ncbi:MAG: methyltransferase family protein [Promethearchaeota archaeon]
MIIFNSNIIRAFFTTIIGLFIIGLCLPMIILKKKGKNPHGTHEGTSFLTKMTTITIFSWLFYIILYIVYGTPLLNFLDINFLISDYFTILGMIIITLGVILDFWGTVTLGTNFRIELPKEDTILITSGIYKLVRNPIVVGLYLLLFGSFLIISTIISLIFLIANIITFDSKIKDEENFLAKRFGENFRKYCKEVGRYFPYCIKKNKL